MILNANLHSADCRGKTLKFLLKNNTKKYLKSCIYIMKKSNFDWIKQHQNLRIWKHDGRVKQVGWTNARGDGETRWSSGQGRWRVCCWSCSAKQCCVDSCSIGIETPSLSNASFSSSRVRHKVFLITIVVKVVLFHFEKKKESELIIGIGLWWCSKDGVWISSKTVELEPMKVRIWIYYFLQWYLLLPHTPTYKRKMRPHHFPQTLYIYSIHNVLVHCA